MNSNLLRTIDDQSLINFSGRINIVTTAERKYLGEIILKDGDVINAKYEQAVGFKALVRAFLDDIYFSKFDLVVVPEIVDTTEKFIHYSCDVLKKKLELLFQETQKVREHKPPNDVKLILDGKFLKSEHDISPNEFEVMRILTEYNVVRDIYEKCDLHDFEITQSLVLLRKKGAIRVIK